MVMCFVLPEGSEFAFHDHPKMNSVQICSFGEIERQSINKEYLKKKGDKFLYLKDKMRVERLTPFGNECTSQVNKEFNIHKIKALKLSGFIDFMLPYYPDKECSHYTVSEEN